MIWPSVTLAILAAVLVTAVVTELRDGRIYNWLTYPAIAVGLGLGALQGWTEGQTWAVLSDRLLGFGFAFGTLFFAWYVLKGMGGGDVKLMAAVGAFLGWPGIVDAMFYSFLVGVAVGLILMIWRGQTRAVLRNLGMAVRLLPNPNVRREEAVPRSVVHVPFALPVCVGTLWFLGESLLGGTLWEGLGRLAGG